MTHSPTIRCKHCQAVLAKAHGETIVVARGNFQVDIEDARRITFVCYRCEAVNSIRGQQGFSG